jgi:hypothetical protein
MLHEMEKQNFVTWHKYATHEEIEKAKGLNIIAFQRLMHEYAEEIDYRDEPSTPTVFMAYHNSGVQEFDLSLKIS